MCCKRNCKPDKSVAQYAVLCWTLLVLTLVLVTVQSSTIRDLQARNAALADSVSMYRAWMDR